MMCFDAIQHLGSTGMWQSTSAKAATYLVHTVRQLMRRRLSAQAEGNVTEAQLHAYAPCISARHVSVTCGAV